MELTMLRRFAPLIVIAVLVLASFAVFVAQKIIAGRDDPCLASLVRSGDDEARKAFEARRTKRNLCDLLVRVSVAEQAGIAYNEDAERKCIVGPILNLYKARYVEAVQSRVEACEAAAIDPDGEVPAPTARAEVLVSVVSDGSSQTSESEGCRELLVSLIQNQNTPPDRAWTAFESHHSKKNYCDYLVQFSDSEQASIDEAAKLHCAVVVGLQAKRAKTMERRMKACDAAAVDPEGVVASYSR
jgi:hypothetical protein